MHDTKGNRREKGNKRETMLIGAFKSGQVRRSTARRPDTE